MPQTKVVITGRWTGGGLRLIAAFTTGARSQVPEKGPKGLWGKERATHGGYPDRLQAEVQFVSWLSAMSLFQAELRACQAGLAEILASPSACRSIQAKRKPPIFSAAEPLAGSPVTEAGGLLLGASSPFISLPCCSSR